ncbi:MAG: CRISPR-associated endonuclease Cas2 [Kiritimatiellae bacterium]|nr:CRISPR-associated endonuclease Cas2 [Kiritimatiellia bacterium]
MSEVDFSAINHYKAMWLYALFDLPTETKKQRKNAALFRKGLLQDGFTMFQFSVYIRHCASRENAEVHIRRVRAMTPEEGRVAIIAVTDRQFDQMVILYGAKEKPPPPAPLQLELF